LEMLVFDSNNRKDNMVLKLAALLCLALPAAAATATALVPVEHFTEEDTYSNPRLSPDGKHIAVNVRMMRNGRMIPTMTVYSLPSLTLVSTIALDGFEIPADFIWQTNNRLLVRKGIEIGRRIQPRLTGEIVAVDLNGAKPQYLYGYKAFRQSSKGERYGDDYGYADIANIAEPRSAKVLLSTHLWQHERSALYEIDSYTSLRKEIANIAHKDLDFVVRNDGTPGFGWSYDDDNHFVLFRPDADGTWKKAELAGEGARYLPYRYSPDDRALYITFSPDGGPDKLMREDVATRKRTILAEDTVFSIGAVQYTARPVQPFAVSLAGGRPVARYLDDNLPEVKLHKSLSASFPDAFVNFINFTDDGERLLFSVLSDRDPGSYYLYDKKAGKAELLFNNMDKIDPERMTERLPVSFSARDGQVLTGFLTAPANPGKHKLPLVLLPHGGPISVHDEWYFDSDAQFLASRGYAVLQVNFRGSSGRGMNFRNAGYREYGGRMLNDMIDGVKWANQRPDIDAGRVCVYGASFGGYAALMLPVREPQMFKCAVGYSGRYHLPSKYSQDNIAGDIQAKNYLIKTLGADMKQLESISPTSLAAQIKLPVLLVHGGNDKVTELKQAEMMRDALIKAGHPPEWVLEKDQEHGFYDPALRKAFYEKLEAFLGKHIGK